MEEQHQQQEPNMKTSAGSIWFRSSTSGERVPISNATGTGLKTTENDCIYINIRFGIGENSYRISKLKFHKRSKIRQHTNKMYMRSYVLSTVLSWNGNIGEKFETHWNESAWVTTSRIGNWKWQTNRLRSPRISPTQITLSKWIGFAHFISVHVNSIEFPTKRKMAYNNNNFLAKFLVTHCHFCYSIKTKRQLGILIRKYGVECCYQCKRGNVFVSNGHELRIRFFSNGKRTFTALPHVWTMVRITNRTISWKQIPKFRPNFDGIKEINNNGGPNISRIVSLHAKEERKKKKKTETNGKLTPGEKIDGMRGR